MLTVDFNRLGLKPGDLVLDMGAGAGRHAFEVYRRGAHIVALDYSLADLKDCAGLFAAMEKAGEAPAGTHWATVNGDGTGLPFGDDTFDYIICSEVMEHIPDDAAAAAELARVLKPGGAARRHRAHVPPRADLLGALRRVPRPVRRPAATSASSPRSSCKNRFTTAGLGSTRARTTPTPCTRRTGGSSAPSAPPTTTTRWSRRTRSSSPGTS